MIVETMELLELYAELLSVRTPILEKCGKQMPEDLREAITTMMFACPRLCIEIPELKQIATYFRNKFGHDFAKFAMAEETAESAGASPRVTIKLAVVAPSHEYKMEKLKEVANEFGLAWEPDPSEFPQSPDFSAHDADIIDDNNTKNEDDISSYVKTSKGVAVIDNSVVQNLPSIPPSTPTLRSQSPPTTTATAAAAANETKTDTELLESDMAKRFAALGVPVIPAAPPAAVAAAKPAPELSENRVSTAIVYATAAEAAAAAREFADKAAAAAEAAAALALADGVDAGSDPVTSDAKSDANTTTSDPTGAVITNELDEEKVHDLLNSAIQAAEAAEFAAEAAASEEMNTCRDANVIDIDAAVHALAGSGLPEASAPPYNSVGTDIFATSNAQNSDNGELDLLAKRFEALKRK